MNNKDLETLTATIVTGQIYLHFLEQLKHTRFYKGKVKETTRANLVQLHKAERNEFEKIWESDEQTAHQISSNYHEIIKRLVGKGFSNMMLLGNMDYALELNPKAVEGIINKVLKESQQ